MKLRGRTLFLIMPLLGGLILLQLVLTPTQQVLVLKDQDTGATYGQWIMEEGSIFSLSFIHSVNKSQVKDVLRVGEGILHAHQTIYSGFGAGVQTELQDGETLSYDENHQMIIGNIQTTYDRLNLIVGTVSDHTLEIHGDKISLRGLCGKNTPVTFSVSQVRGAKDIEK